LQTKIATEENSEPEITGSHEKWKKVQIEKAGKLEMTESNSRNETNQRRSKKKKKTGDKKAGSKAWEQGGGASC